MSRRLDDSGSHSGFLHRETQRIILLFPTHCGFFDFWGFDLLTVTILDWDLEDVLGTLKGFYPLENTFIQQCKGSYRFFKRFKINRSLGLIF